MAIFLEYEGIKGSVTTKGYEGMIKLDSARLGIRRSISMEVGNLKNRESTRATFEVFETTKRYDCSTIHLYQEALGGSKGKTVKIHYTKTREDTLETYLTIELTDCLPTLYKLVAIGYTNNAPAERLYLSYTSLIASYFPRDENNRIQSPIRGGYDLAQAKII